jgi:hypothetical protein
MSRAILEVISQAVITIGFGKHFLLDSAGLSVNSKTALEDPNRYAIPEDKNPISSGGIGSAPNY